MACSWRRMRAIYGGRRPCRPRRCSGREVIEARLERARLSNSFLSQADLPISDLNHAVLMRANLTKADLRGCNMRGADLTCANLAGANLEGVILIGATMSGTNFEGTSLVGVLFDEVDLAHGRIRNSTGTRNFHGLGRGLAQILSGHATWTRSGGQSGQRADLTGVDLSGHDLRGVDLGAAVLHGAVLRRTNLAGALLAMADLSLVDAREANLTNADLRGAKLERATLSSAKLMEACAKPLLIAGEHKCPTDCTSARLDHACLLRADLSMALLVGADLTEADIRRTDLRGASLARGHPEWRGTARGRAGRGGPDGGDRYHGAAHGPCDALSGSGSAVVRSAIHGRRVLPAAIRAEARPLGGTAHLFAEDAIGACQHQVALLLGGLVRGGCHRVSDDHVLVPPWCPLCIFDTVGRTVRQENVYFIRTRFPGDCCHGGMSSVGMPYSDK